MMIETDGRPDPRVRWHSRCLLLGWLCLLPLIGSLLYAQSAWPVALYRMIVDGGTALLWIAGAMGLGMFFCGVMRLWDASTPASLRLASSAAAGLGLLSLAVLGLGLAGLLNVATAWGLIGLGWIAGIAAARLESVRDADPTGIVHGWALRQWLTDSGGWEWLGLLATPFLALALTAALIPPGMLWNPEEPHGYDVVEYHLQAPREWYEAHRIVPPDHNVYAYFPFNVEMHYLLAMHLRGGPWAGMYLCQFMHLTFMVLTVVAVFGLARRHAGSAGAMIAAMSLLSVPWLTQLAGIAYDEGGFLLFGVLSIGWALKSVFTDPTPVLRYAEEPDRTSKNPALRSTSEPASSASASVTKQTPDSCHRFRRFAFAGAMAGFAAGSKLTAVPEVLLAVPLVCAAMAILRTIVRSDRALPQCAGIALFCLVGIVTFSPWLIRNVKWTGNPVFPELMPLLGSNDFTPVQVQRWELAHQPPPEQRPVRARVKRFCREIILGWQFGYLLLPMGLTAFALSVRRPTAWALLGLLFALTIIWLFFTHLQGRFFVLAAPLAALLIAQIDWCRYPFVGVVPVIVFSSIGWFQINSRFCLKLYGAGDGAGLVQVLGIDDLSWIFLKQPPLSAIPPDAPLCLVGDARAFWYPLPMSRLRYRTVFNVRGDEADIVNAWIGPDGKRPGEIFLIDPEELKRLGKSYYGLPPLPDEVKMRPERYVMP